MEVLFDLYIYRYVGNSGNSLHENEAMILQLKSVTFRPADVSFLDKLKPYKWKISQRQ